MKSSRWTCLRLLAELRPLKEVKLKIRKAVFTICASNYYGLAQVLKQSVMRSNPDVEFFVFIADEIPELVRHKFGDDVIDATVTVGAAIGHEKFREMAFKYNLTEFCTAIKPFCFQHVFTLTGVDKVIYLDPDILVFSALDEIFSILETRSVALTPHVVFPSLYEGKRPDRGLLATGLFNLGFLGLARSDVSSNLLAWWGSRLRDQCFIDGHDALFTDQKWMDFIPSLFPSEAICYFRSMGTNMAPWNFHERQIVVESDGSFSVIRRAHPDSSGDIRTVAPTRDKLVFVHFSGFDYKMFCEGKVAQYNIDGLDIHDDLAPIIECYMHELQALNNVVVSFLGTPYGYARFENGKPILAFHRRLYRAALDAGMKLGEPFAAQPGSFFSMLEKSSLVLDSPVQASFEKSNKNNLSGIGRKLSLFNTLMRAVKRLFGFSNYALLLRLMRPYSRPESQLHLIDRRYDQIL
jgi:hypothetical protein